MRNNFIEELLQLVRTLLKLASREVPVNADKVLHLLTCLNRKIAVAGQRVCFNTSVVSAARL
jgi:hypothetical protein